jgi:hypothetical protein
MLVIARNATMNISIRLILLAAGVLAAAGAVYAQGNEIYTWTDENGVIHYTDTVPDNPNAARMEAPEAYFPGSADAYPDEDTAEVTSAEKQADTDPEEPDNAENEQTNSPDGTESEEISYAEQRRRELAHNREEHRKERAERENLCTAAREQIATLEPNRRVFFTNDKGETERMDDEVRVGKVEEAKAQAAEYCD